MTAVPVTDDERITVERLERAITATADAMTRHNLPQLLPTLKRLEAERENLRSSGDRSSTRSARLRRS